MTDVEALRRGVEELNLKLALHDQKVDTAVAHMAETQERVATAMERLTETMVALRTLAQQRQERESHQRDSTLSMGDSAIRLSPKMFTMLIGGIVFLALVLGVGQEIAQRIFKALLP